MRLSTTAALVLVAAAAHGQIITSDTGHHLGDGYPRAVAKLSPAALGCGPGGTTLVVGDERTFQPRIVSLTGAGDVQTYPASGAPVAGIAVAADGTIYASDPYLHTVWRLPAGGGVAERYAGGTNGGLGGFAGDGGSATAAMLNAPMGLALDAQGNLYIADSANQRIRRVDAATRIITTAAGGNASCPNTTCDGGPATQARLSIPAGVVIADGTIYIAERLGQRVRAVSPAGTISTVAGNGYVGLNGDGGPATAATLTQPSDVAVGPDGSLYIADTRNHAVRRVRGGIISTVAGTGFAGAGADGQAAASRLDSPRAVEWCGGKLYVGEQGANQRIRAIDLGSILPPTSTPTRTAAAVSTLTFTPSATPTQTLTPTHTRTATPTCGCCAQCG